MRATPAPAPWLGGSPSLAEEMSLGRGVYGSVTRLLTPSGGHHTLHELGTRRCLTPLAQRAVSYASSLLWGSLSTHQLAPSLAVGGAAQALADL